MTITEILQVKIAHNEPVFTVRDANGHDHDLTLAKGTTFDLMAGLVRCALVIQRDDPDPRFSRGPTYALTDCSILTTESHEHGIALRTTDGFDLLIILDPQMRARMKACIEQIENPHPPGGLIH
jgi:hypothetical protein